MGLTYPSVNALGVSTDGNTGGNTGTSNGTWVMIASTNITVSQSTGTNNIHSFYLSAGAGGPGGGAALSAGTQSGNTGTVVFSNSNGISFGMSGSSQITASYTVPSIAGLISNVNLSAGTTSGNLSAVTFGDGNGISFGLNASTITASHNALTSQSNQAFSAQGGSSAFQTLVFTNSNGISFSNTGGSVWASHNALTSQSNQALSAGNGSFAFQTATFADSNGVSFSTGTQGIYATVKTDYLTSQSNQALSGSNGSYAFQTATFGNLNGISFYTSNGSMVGSYTVPTQSNQTVGLYALGNTTQNSSTTLDARTLSFNGLGGMTVGYSNGSIQMSAPQTVAQTNQTVGLYAVGNTTQNSSSTLDARTISFNGAGNVSVGYSNGSVVISGGTAAASPVNISAGTTSNNLQSIVFSNSNGVSFGLNGSTITASVSAYTASRYPLQPPPMATSSAYSGSTTTTAGGSRSAISIYVSPFFVDEYVTYNQVMAPMSLTQSAGTFSQTAANMWMLYTDNAGTLSSVSSWMQGMVLSQNSATNYTQNWWWGSNSTSNSSQTSGNVSGSFARLNNVLLATGASSISPGNYWLAYAQSMSSNAGNVAFSAMHVSRSQTTMASMYGSNVSSLNDRFFGIVSTTVTSNAAHVFIMPSSINRTNITGTGGSSQNRSNVIFFGSV